MRVVPHEKTTEFKQKLIVILQSLPSRSFELLRERVLAALHEMCQNDQDNDNPRYVINDSTFSKHFWYDYLKANADVEEIYSKLPICRNFGNSNGNVFRGFLKTSEEVKDGRSDESENEFSIFLSSFDPTLDFSPVENVNTENQWCATQEPQIQLDTLPEQGFSSTGTVMSPGQTAVNDVAEYEKEEDANSNNSIFDCSNSNSNSEMSLFDFYRSNKMIVETEDNDTQKTFFREFYQNGI